MATQSIDLGVNTRAAHQELADFAQSVNTMLQQKGAASGKTVRLYDAKADLAELKAMQKAMQDVIRLHGSIRGPMNAVGQNTAATFNQINTAAMFPGDAARQVKFIVDLMARTMTQHFAHGQFTNRTGLDYQQLTGRQPGVNPINPPAPPAPPKQPDTRLGASVHHLASQAVQGGAGGSLGQAAGIAMQGAASGLGGMGMVGGGLLAAAGYGVFKAASTVSDGLDRSKSEAIEIDRFKRQLGDLGVNFDGLRDHVREAATGMGLSFEQAGKMAQILSRDSNSKIKDEKSIGEETKNAAALARSTGVDGDTIARFFAEMRASRSTDDVQGSRKMALSIADAIKRSGDPMNADKMLQHMVSFTERTRDLTLGRMDAGAYGGLLSGLMSGAGGIKAGTAAGMINSFDQSSRAGGNSEAADGFFFQALHGNDIGAGKALALRQGGLFASTQSMFGDSKSPLFNQKFKGGTNTTNLQKYMDQLDQVFGKGESEQKTMALAELGFGGNWAHAAQWQRTYKDFGAGGLNKTASMLDQYKINPDQINMAGLTQIAGIANAGGDVGKLQEQRALLAGRSDLKPGDVKLLDGLKDSANPKALADAMVGIARTLDSEETDGKKLNDMTKTIENNIQSMATSLIPASMWTNNLLAGLLEKANPDSVVAKQYQASKEAEITSEASLPGASAGLVATANGFSDRDGKKYLKDIYRVENELGMAPGSLAALAFKEGGFNPHHTSGHGVDKNGNPYTTQARGMFQMLPGAIKDATPGFSAKFNGRNPSMDDPVDQMWMAGIYAQMMTQKAGGDPVKGYGLYHGGAGYNPATSPISAAQLDQSKAEYAGHMSRFARAAKIYRMDPDAFDLSASGGVPAKVNPAKIPSGDPARAAFAATQAIQFGVDVSASKPLRVLDRDGNDAMDPIFFTASAGKPKASGVSSAYRGPR